jgi:hypothetical protein
MTVPYSEGGAAAVYCLGEDSIGRASGSAGEAASRAVEHVSWRRLREGRFT